MTDSEIIDQIQAIRSRNNGTWMNLVRLALEVAPDRARAIFSEISKNDAEILKLSQKLAAPSPTTAAYQHPEDAQ